MSSSLEGGQPPTAREGPLLIVGVGASAGGLEAVQAFLRYIPADSGLTFVVVFHLDPTAPPLLPELLAKAAAFPVAEATDGVLLEANRVYTSPAQCILLIEDEKLRVVPAERPEERRAPIDRLLHSLGRERGERAVAVILSGTGSDGALGLKSVAEAGGLALAQAPETARHESMPQSALATGAVDHALPPEQLAEELVAYARHFRAGGTIEALRQEITDVLPTICDLLLQSSGHNFKHYKTSTLVRRTLRRVQVLRLSSAREYLERLRADAAEIDGLFKDLLIGVTAFFRDPDAFAILAKEVLPRFFDGRSGEGPIRIWVPGCSTGEEAYTLAMLLREERDRHASPLEVQVFATDIDEQALATARLGAYPLGIADEVPPDRLARFFSKKGGQYQVTRELRELVLFSAHNLINDPPFSRLDLISCRNLLIYLGSHLQKKLIPLFHYALRPGGFLFLGPSESLTAHRELFRPLDARHRISQRLPTAIRPPGPWAPREGAPTPVRPPNVPSQEETDTYLLMQRIVLDEFAPKTVVVNAEGQVICASGNLEKYLTLTAGAFQNNLVRLARDGLRVGLRATLAEAAKVQRKVVHQGLSVPVGTGMQPVLLTVQPMPQMGEESALYLVVFQDIGLPLARAEAPAQAGHGHDAPAIIEQLERELTTTRNDLERSVQDLEAANEELKSNNEELLSMNEELQSANEELETSKEEVQAANDALARANGDLENLLSSTRIATLFLDEQGLIRRVTPAIEAIYNVTLADIGRPLRHFTHRLECMPPLPSADEVRQAQAPIEDEVRGDGGWYLRRALPYRNQEGRAEGIVVTFTDITASKQAQEAIHDQERHLRALFSQATVGIAQYDPTGRIVLANERYAQLVGRSGQELIQLRWQDITHPEDLPTNQAQFDRAIRECEPFEIEKRFVRPNGSIVWVNKSASPLRGADGQTTHVVAVLADISERKQAEAELAEAHARLEESFALLDALFTNAPVGLAFLDRELRYVRINEALAEIYGPPAPHYLGRPVVEVIPQLWPVIEPLLRRALAGEAVVNQEVSGEVPSQPGRRRHWLVNYYPIRGADQEVLGVGAVVAEITVQKHAAELLRQADRRKDEFLATLGHELRNPLAPIRSAVQVLRLLEMPCQEAREARDMIARQVEVMARLVDDLLDVSRIAENKLVLQKQRCELSNVVAQAVETVRPMAEAAGHDLQVTLPAEPIYLHADPVRLAQVFSNLLTNACKYTDKGGQIAVTVSRESGEGVVRVRDNGIGIRAEHLSGLFEKFSQVATALERAQGGLGLGLSLVRGLVEMHGGRVAAHSDGLGQGSAFTVRLPLLSGPPTPLPPTHGTTPTARARTRRVLIVDDNVDAALSLAVLLRLVGNEVETAHDGIQAIEVAERFRPGVILMDLGMPRLNGYEACRRIREEPWGQEIRLIALTGWGQDEDRRRTRAAGFDDHLIKPIDPGELTKLLTEDRRE